MEIRFAMLSRVEFTAARQPSLAISILRLAGAERKSMPDESRLEAPMGIAVENDVVLLSEASASEAVDRAVNLITNYPTAGIAAHSGMGLLRG